jgi:hypothetical protein
MGEGSFRVAGGISANESFVALTNKGFQNLRLLDSKSFRRICTKGGGLLLSAALGVSFLPGCGYRWKAVESDWLARKGVHRVYVAPVLNNSYKVGVENGVYNQLVRTLKTEGVVELVAQESDADAILEATVLDAAFNPSGTTTTANLFPAGKVSGVQGSSNVLVATEFSATLSCSFRLLKRGPETPSARQLWAGTVARTRLFPANNQLGSFGTTSALLNESEFDRALKDLSQRIVAEMHESLRISF